VRFKLPKPKVQNKIEKEIFKALDKHDAKRAREEAMQREAELIERRRQTLNSMSPRLKRKLLDRIAERKAQRGKR